QVRYLGFTYGLSTLDVGAGGTLALSAPDNVWAQTEFTVTAYVYNAREGQAITLELPRGMSLAAGESEGQTVRKTAARTTVSWKVRAGDAGTYEIRARKGKGGAPAKLKVEVKKKSLFG